ncbi:MAG: hypothetical protein IJF92_00190 [Bacilli bacterium]|nr:hypothetical protein [Bacilli bacterium]MBQ3307591.1 hypothetical protein [Bacilli bacterium]
MTIPSYDETLCPYCILKDICNKKKFKEKIKTQDKYSKYKYSYCEEYKCVYSTYKEGENETN